MHASITRAAAAAPVAVIVAALACAGAALLGASAAIAAPAAHLPALAIVFHVRPPASDDPTLAAADVALRAPEELGEPLRALRDHPAARLAFAADPEYLEALDRAAVGKSALVDAISSSTQSSGAREIGLLTILERHRPLDGGSSRTPAGARYLTLATAATNERNGERSVPFTAHDIAEFAGISAQVALAASGYGAALGPVQQSQAAVAALARADKTVDDELKADIRAGRVELVATPVGEPVLPLLVDAGAKSTTDPHYVAVGAAADAQWLASDAVRRTRTAAPGQPQTGFYSPFGAYDDATGTVVQASGASYALFSDRVVHGAGGAGTEGGVNAAGAAALRSYALTVDRGVVLPVLFWSEAESDDLQAVSGTDTAMAERLVALARDAGVRAAGMTPSVFVLRIEAQGPWSQRPDARTVVARLVAAIASGRGGSATTPGAFVRAHRPTAQAYGYPPATESGSFGLWMGSADQASLWNALAVARKAAGGDAALSRPAVRSVIFAAEAGGWYSGIGAPIPGAAAADRLDAFRVLIASVYRAAGLTPPANIAPLAKASPAPSPSPAPSAPASSPMPHPSR